MDVDPGRSRGCRILSRRPQLPPEAASLVRERSDDDRDRTQRRLQEAGRLRNRRQRQRTGTDLLPVPEDVVRHAENGEGGDPGGEAGQPHERYADEQREHAPHGSRERERRGVAE